jgi:hypothetical protein
VAVDDGFEAVRLFVLVDGDCVWHAGNGNTPAWFTARGA